MSIEQYKAMSFDCTNCGNGQQLIINNVKYGFFDTGWRADFSRLDAPGFICAVCVTGWKGRRLEEQKQYLEHIFEAQRRFGE